MKVGDKIQHNKHEGFATVVNMKVETVLDDFKGKPITKSSYTARYENGALLKFYGYDIGKRVFKVKGNQATQLSMFDNNENQNEKEF